MQAKGAGLQPQQQLDREQRGSWARAAAAQGEQAVPLERAGCQVGCQLPPEAAVAHKSSLCEAPSPALKHRRPPPRRVLSSLAEEEAWW